MRGVSLLFPKSEDGIFYKKLNTQSKEAIWVAFKQYVLEMYHLCRPQRLFVIRRIFMFIGTHMKIT